MNSYERCMAAIQMKPVDRLPVDLHNFAVCADASGMHYDEFFLDAQAMADMQIELQKEYGHDVLLIENGTATLAEALGCDVAYQQNGIPVANKPAVDTLEKTTDWEIPENLLESPLLKANLKTVELLKNYFHDEVFLMGRGDQGPFSLAAEIYGMNNLLMDLMDEDMEEEIFGLLEYCTKACICYHKALLKAGAHCTSMGDSTAGPDVVSPAMYEKFAMPYEKKIIDAVHEAGGLISLHICGNATKIMPQMCSLGADILEIDQKTDLAKAVEIARGKCTLLGQVSPIILKEGSVEKIKEAGEKTISVVGGKSQTGYIFGPGCALGGSTPKENIHALVNCVIAE